MSIRNRSMTILHVDMDAFFAAIEQRDNPDLRGKPVIVGGIGSRGVVSTASYEARPFGVRSAMPMAAARRLCPNGIFLAGRIKHYADIGRRIRSILLEFTPLVEPLSLDEAFLDVAGCEHIFGPAPEIARRIRERIHKETQLIASVGVAPNKFLAKLAGDIGKPDGLLVIEPDQVQAFLDPLPVSRIWGVGSRGEEKLKKLGIETVGQLARYPEDLIIDHFGETGKHIRKLANGVDDRKVTPDREAKSISTETTFSDDIDDPETLRIILLQLVDQLTTRLRAQKVRAKTIDVKIRSADFRTHTHSKSLPQASDVTQEIWHTVEELFQRGLKRKILPVRLLGVGAGKLTREVAIQGSLFEEDDNQRHSQLDTTIDAIRGQFGTGAIQRGSLLGKKKKPEKK